MSTSPPQIGFDRHLELTWLDEVAAWSRAGLPETEIAENFERLLASIDQSDVANRKNRTVLRGVWLKVPPGIESFHTAALDLLDSAPEPSRLAVHYGRCMVAYPFFAFVAGQVGRLASLQADVYARDIYRRSAEHYGDRARVRRSTQHVISTLVAWHVLDRVGTGHYLPAPATTIDSVPLVAWLLEADLRSSNQNSCELASLYGHPVLFPFALRRVGASELGHANPRLDIVRQGLSEEIVQLRR